MKKILLIFFCLIFLSAAVYGVKYFYDLKSYKNITSTLETKDVDISKIKDGSYIGECNAKFVEAKVRVNVKNGKITGIDLLEHRNGRGKPAEVIPQRVVAAQSLKVDTVSGATNSSKVILKAIENALEK